MSDKKRYQLDNAAHVFTASCNKKDRRTERISCTLKEDVDPEALQQALDETIKVRKQFQVHIKRGFFWYYFEENVRPFPGVKPENTYPCSFMHQYENNEYLFRVTYYKKRINLN